MKLILPILLTALTGCAQMYPKTAHLPECQFKNLKPGEILPHKCGDWGNPGTKTVTVRTYGSTTYISTK